MNPDCYNGDHTWRGTSLCVYCGIRLRCECGQFVREDGFDAHYKRCPWMRAILAKEREDFEKTLL